MKQQGVDDETSLQVTMRTEEGDSLAGELWGGRESGRWKLTDDRSLAVPILSWWR